MEQEINCPICGSKKIKFFCEKNRYNIYNCQDCEVGFVWPEPSSLADIYQAPYFKGDLDDGGINKFGYTDYEEDKKAMRETFVIYLNKILKLTTGKKIFDVGAATGYFLDLAKRAGWQTSGIEISEYAVKIASAKGHQIFLGDLEDLESKERYDVITMWDVLEHLADPKKYLKSVHDVLHQEGILAINTINRSSWWARLWGRNWQAIMPPEHLFYYSVESLKILLEQGGFRIIEKSKIAKKFTLPYIFKVLERRYNLPFLGKLSDLLYKAGFKIGLPVNLRDNIFIIAKKIETF